VRKFWKREDDALERVLRAERPVARDEFVAQLAERTAASAPVRRWSRVAFASALTVFMLGFFASFGGIGYAAANLHSATRTVTRIVVPAKTSAVRHVQSASQAQYGPSQVYTPPAATPKPKVIQVAGIQTEQPPASTSSELPFTGFGLGATAGLGLGLLVLGVFLRRRESGSRA
jgi:hypothetical protein